MGIVTLFKADLFKPGVWAAPGVLQSLCPHSKDVTTTEHSFYFLLFPLKLMWNSSKACHYSHARSVWVCCPALSLEAFQPWVQRGELLCLMWSGWSEGVKMARVGQAVLGMWWHHHDSGSLGGFSLRHWACLHWKLWITWMSLGFIKNYHSGLVTCLWFR